MSDKLDIEAADTRILRAARETLRRGRFVPQDPAEGGSRRIAVIERGGTSYVSVDPAWVRSPTCTCYDHQMNARLGMQPWCRHIVAVLAKEEELRCQLIDMLL
jgi:predicted nucleic acid-binding Zn finger protein